MVAPAERLREPPLDHGAQCGPAVHGRTFETERPTGAQRRDSRPDSSRQVARSETVCRVVECAEILVRGCRRGAATPEPQDQGGGYQPERRSRGTPPQRSSEHSGVQLVDQILEPTHGQPGDRTGHGGQKNDLARTPNQFPQLVPADLEGLGPQSPHHPSAPHVGECRTAGLAPAQQRMKTSCGRRRGAPYQADRSAR